MTILPDSQEFVGPAGWNGHGWQHHMKIAVRTAEELARRLNLPLDFICGSQSSGTFPLFVPLPYLSRIEQGNPEDPLLKQILPTTHEELDSGGSDDPVSESEFVLAPGILKKYAGRALMVVNGTCAIHCRYCFRRHFPYSDRALEKNSWSKTLAALKVDSTIEEVILSGGDPLTMVDRTLNELLNEIEAIPHVLRVRIHTRLPIVIPQRVTEQLLSMLRATRPDVVVVVHCNHRNELDDFVRDRLFELQSATRILLNQSVLLRGINDNVESLCELGSRLIECGVLPYYLHQLDPVQGASHFEVDTETGRQLVEQLRRRLPGYMVPKYVQEVPGEPYKTIL